MKVKKIKINSFRGLKDLEFELTDFNDFSGRNGIGKSTILDAIMWMLTGETLVYGKQDSDNRNSNSIRDVVNVELTIEFDGAETTLERKYYDNWVVDKEGNEKFSEVKNMYFVNGAKYKKDEYFEFIKNIINVPSNISIPKDYNLLRSLMDYNYYSSIDYKIARKFTEGLLNLQSDKEILSADEYTPIRADMTILNYDFSKCSNKYATKKKEVETLVSTKEILLENYQNQYDESKIQEIERLEEKRKQEIAKIFNNKPKIRGKIERLEEIRLIIQKETENQKNATFDLLQELKETLNDIYKFDKLLSSEQKRLEIEREHYDSRKKEIETHYQLMKNLKETIFKEIRCPNCGELINKEEYEKAKVEVENNIENIQNHICKMQNELVNNEKTRQLIRENILDYFEKGEKLREKRNEIKEKINDLSYLQKLEEYKEEQKRLENEIDADRIDFENQRNKRITDLTLKISEYAEIKTLGNKIVELEKEIKQLKAEVFSCEIKKDLVQDFKNAKLQLLKQHTNALFPQLDFEILEVNENTGTVKEVCYVKLKGVEFKGINDGHRKLVGILIIEDIKKALGIADIPIIFDKRADIDDDMLAEIKKITNAQLITTSVSNDTTIINKGE